MTKRQRFSVGDGTYTKHRQVRVRVSNEHGDWERDVDEKLAPLIAELWRAGWETSRSCQHHGSGGKVWIEFSYPEDAAAFLSVVAAHGQDLPERMESFFVSFRRQSEQLHSSLKDRGVAGPCKLHTHADQSDDDRLWSSISVLFPRRDLKTAIEAMREFHADSC